MLNGIVEQNLKDETVLIYVPSLLSLMFIHSIGKSTMKKINYTPIYNLFHFVIQRDYFFFDRFGDIAVSVGNIINELENYGFVMKDFLIFHVKLLKNLLIKGLKLGYWKSIDYDYIEKHVDNSIKQLQDMQLKDLNLNRYKYRKDKFLLDRLSILCRFILSYMKTSWIKNFIHFNGLKILMTFTNLPCFPPNYIHIFEYHPIYSLIMKIYLYASFKSLYNQFLYPLYNFTNFIMYTQYVNFILNNKLIFDLDTNIVVVKKDELRNILKMEPNTNNKHNTNSCNNIHNNRESENAYKDLNKHKKNSYKYHMDNNKYLKKGNFCGPYIDRSYWPSKYR